MKVEYLCNNAHASSVATVETYTKKHYNAHAAMHYDGGGWSSYQIINYVIDKCGGKHELSQSEIL